MGAVRLVEPDGAGTVVDGEAEPVAGGSVDLLPLLVCGLDLVPEPMGTPLADGVDAISCGIPDSEDVVTVPRSLVFRLVIHLMAQLPERVA